MKARVGNLSKTEAEWDKLNFIPLEGEFVVYLADESCRYARLKVGDGKTPLHSLPFFTDMLIEDKLNEHKRLEIIDAGKISSYFPK